MHCDFILNRKNVVELAIEPIRPDMVPVACVNELHADADAVACFTYAALQERLDSEPCADVARVHVRSSKCKARCPRRYMQARDLCQCIEDLFSDAISEVFLISVPAEV